MDIRQAPHDTENEQQILGAILLNEKLIKEITDDIKPSMFYQSIHNNIYQSMLYLHYHNISIGYETLLNRMKSQHNLDDEALDYLIGLNSCSASSATFENRIELLKDMYYKRELYNLSIKNVTQDISGVASSAMVKEFEDIVENMGVTSNLEYEQMSDYIDEWVDELESDKPVISYKLGFAQTDDIILLTPTDLMLIGARPSVGKSAFALNLVKNFCDDGYNPLFISLEMSKKQFMDRLIANIARVEVEKLTRKIKLTNDEWKRIMEARQLVKGYDFSIYDKGGMSIEQLCGLATYLKKKNKLDILVIDYLQLLTSNQYKGQKQNQVGYISQRLKQLAMELEIPVIALSQLSRASVENGKPREPHLVDLRDSGSLEQDANMVLMLHTDDVDQVFKDKRFIKLFIRKNRSGRLGKVDFTYYGDYASFVEKVWEN